MSVIIPDATKAPTEMPPLALPVKYELDPFQQHAILGIHAGAHVFVTAKTGSGKTFVGEYLIAYYLAKGQRVFYTTPIKSLTNQKFHDLKKLFPNATVGILTGDVKMNPDAQIIVMTAEILRNLLYKEGTVTASVGLTAAVSLCGVGGLVIDEAHYIQDPDRGHVWEETLIMATKTLQIVLLSATMPSATPLSKWLAELHQRDVWLLSTTHRVVPLVHGVLDSTMTVRPLLEKGYWTESYSTWLRERRSAVDAAAAHKRAVEGRKADGYASAPPQNKSRIESPIARLLRTVAWLDETKQMPALFFTFSRKNCERYAGLMTGSLLDSSDAAAATHIIDFHLSRYRKILETSPQYHKIRDLLIRGIGFHHSGLQPLLKEIVEILFTRGYVRILFATETFSVGLNMPTKTVVFLELEKFSDTGRRLLRTDEYIQMAGRAGRRGLDTRGLVLYEPLGDPIDSGSLSSMLTGALPALTSCMRFHYDFILRDALIQGPNQDLATKSYWAQQQKVNRQQFDLEIAKLNERAKQYDISPIDIDLILQKDALDLEVANSVNAKRKKAEAALRKWSSENSIRPGQVELFRSRQRITDEILKLKTIIDEWDLRPLLNLAPLKSCLIDWGFMNPDFSLTNLGISATEVHEGHLILMPMLAASKKLDSLTLEEIPCVLAAFMREGDVEGLSISDANLRPEVTDILHWLDQISESCQKAEDRARVVAPNNFWKMSVTWVCIVSRWISGFTLSQIASEFDIFEGNIQRGILKLVNLLDEWAAIATLREDLQTLDRLRQINLVRDELITDSLYLRL